MACRLPIFALMVVAVYAALSANLKAQTDSVYEVARDSYAPIAAQSPLSPEQTAGLLPRACNLLQRRTTLSARLRFQSQVHGQSVLGTGSYAQGPAHLGYLRWDLTMQVGDRSGSLQQIADGRNLWIQRQLHDKSTIQRVDLGRLPRDDAGQMPAPIFVPAGGLPELLRSLDQAFEFVAALPAEVDGRAVYAVRGQWKQAALDRLLPQHAGKPVSPEILAELPEYVPDQVIVLLGRDDFFPYRIEYRRNQLPGSVGKTEQGRAGQGGNSATPTAGISLMTIEWFDVVFDVPLDRSLFVFNPAGSNVEDVTNHFISTMRRWP